MLSRVLTETQAQELFDDLKNNPDILFKYVSDCCFARAHEMCGIMDSKGIPNGKTWYYATGKPFLSVPVPIYMWQFSMDGQGNPNNRISKNTNNDIYYRALNVIPEQYDETYKKTKEKFREHFSELEKGN